MAVLEFGGKIISLNPALAALLERDRGGLIGAALDDFMLPPDAERFRAFFRDFTQGQAPDHYFQAPFLPSQPRYAWWSVQVANLNVEFEGSRFFSAVCEDITLKKANEEKLHEARRLADQGNEAKSHFLANMTHEIRTPIHTITGIMGLLSQTCLTKEQKDYIKQGTSSADALMSLVDDVLDFSKIESGRMVLDESDFVLDEVVGQALDLVAARAYAKGLEIVVSQDLATTLTVRGDGHRIRQVLVNLLSNAVKFVQEGFIWVRTRLESAQQDRLFYMVEVEDTGIGIETEHQSRLFHPFHQGDNSTTRRFGGTGLGLSISRRLARMMGGDIKLTSATGRGSIFTFTFTAYGNTADLPDSALIRDLYRGQRAMVLDGNEPARNALCHMLQDWGFETKHFKSGKEALQDLAGENSPWNLVVVSENLTDYDPWSLAGVLGSLDQLRGVPLMLCSSPLHSLETAKRKESGFFQGYITKPIRPRLLAAEVMRALRGEPTAAVPSKVLSSSGDLYSLQGVKVLIVEDHEVNRALFKIILEKMGATTILASNGRDALNRFQEVRPDIVFMDLQMPELNGFEAASRLRELGADMPIVAVSASALKCEVEKAKASGMDDFISKPFKRADIERALERLEFGSAQTPRVVPCVSSTDEIFAYQEALETFMGNKDVLFRVLRSFLERCDRDMELVRAAMDAGDKETLFRLAHTLKGSALNLAARKFGQTAAKLESVARDAFVPKETEPLFLALIHEWEAFRLEATSRLDGVSGD